MLTWQFTELLREPVNFIQEIDCTIIVEERFDVIAVEQATVTGKIEFDGVQGVLTVKINLRALMLAANTGETVAITVPFECKEVFSLTTAVEYLDLERQMVTLNGYLLMIIDTLLPTYVVDTTQHIRHTQAEYWQLVDEETYLAQKQAKQSQNGLSGLSSLLEKKQ